jgi:transposase
MQTITTIGLDIAKSVFQVHGVDYDGKVVIRRQLKRRYVLAFFEKLQPCLVGIEACCLVTPLVTRAAGTWPYRTVDAAGLRQALRQTAEERCGRRRGHL